MNKSEMLNKLLYLHNNLLYIVDVANKKVIDIHKGNVLICHEATFEELCDIFAKYFDLIDSFKNKLLKFLNNLEPQDEPFELTINYTKTDGNPTAITYKGLKIDDTHIMLTLSSESNPSQSKLDELTKCNTKTFLMEKVADAIKDNKEFALMLVDIDNFKDINEEYGHMFGDMILIETAASLRNFIKNKGYIARIGGDEFMVFIYIEDDYDKIHAACTELRTTVAKLNGRNIKNASLSATVGCTSFPKDGDNFEILFKKADSALLRGKRKGRNCFIIYTPERCGVITLDSTLTSSEKTMDRTVQSVNNYNVISGIIELLNRNYNVKTNIYDSLSLIGNYFVLDRISLCVQDPDTGKIAYTLAWHNPLVDSPNITYKQGNIELWKKVYDKTHMIKINQVSSNKELAIYDILSSQRTSAIVAFELVYEGKYYGQIRFDMCTINRFWVSTDVSALMLLSKTFAIKLASEYTNQKHYNDLYIDKLTGCKNLTRWLIDVKESRRDYTGPYSILTLKIVDFYSLNSIFGSNECDRIIKRIATWGNSNCKNGIFCRITDQIFALYTKITDKDILQQEFNSLYDFIINTGHSKLNGIRLRIGAYIAENNESIEDAMDKAALARDNKVLDDDMVYYTDELYKDTLEQKMLELHIEEALKNNEFLLYIQPKISAKTKKIVAAEALTRWNYKFTQIIPPFKFIPLFEKLGYITELDFKVFENVCKFLRNIMDKGLDPVPISVNVSRYTRDYNNYIKTINSIRNKYNIPVSLIELEITEGMYTENVGDIKQFVDLLRKEGYTISIDDFGSGYSNLNNISKLKFEILKLDKSLCSMVSEEGIIILDAIIKTAKKTGHIIVCEGVETENEYIALRDLGADLIQGYYFDRPLEKDDFETKYIN
ncbi:MAG: GGDEF and EAL domain-containing protein [Acholeplasmatales bacterium]|nr:GGDEF and EAL domain-containing protein [Acholeplasmatales bacterium]